MRKQGELESKVKAILKNQNINEDDKIHVLDDIKTIKACELTLSDRTILEHALKLGAVMKILEESINSIYEFIEKYSQEDQEDEE